MFTFPACIMANQSGGSWTNWTGVANGSNYPFTSGSFTNATIVSVEMLSTTQFVLFYTDAVNMNIGCVVGTISGTAVSYGSPAIIQSLSIDGIDPPSHISTCFIASATIAITWSATNPGNGHVDVFASAISVSGSTITAGAFLQVTSSGAAQQLESTEITALTSTTAVLAYSESGFITLTAISLSGLVVSAGTPRPIGTVNYKRPSIIYYASGKAVLSYSYPLGGVIYAQVVNISGTTIGTLGSQYQVDVIGATDIVDISNAAMSTGGVVLTYINNIGNANNNYQQKGCYLSLSGNVVTPGTPVTINAASSIAITNGWTEFLNSVNAMVAYVYNFSVINAKVLTLSGTNITVGTAVQLQSSQTPGGGQLLSNLDPATVISCATDGIGRAVTKVLKVS